MTRQELCDVFGETFAECYNIMEKKNNDYARQQDALANFELVNKLGVASTAQGILVRLSDKFQRICNIYNKDASVAETVDDTIKDMINYLVILKAVLQK